MREQARQQQLTEREQRNVLDQQQQQQQDSEGDRPQDSTAGPSESAREGSMDAAAPAIGGAGGSDEHFGSGSSIDMSKAGTTAKRGRKKDDSFVETAAYTIKNMPEDLRNKISNQTALRAAGGIRKSWMTADGASANRVPSVSGVAPSTGFGMAHGHKRNRSSLGTSSDFEGAVSASPGADGLTPTSFGAQRSLPPLASLRSTPLTTPLLVTVRDCLFSLERERQSNVRVGRGDRVLIRAYAKYVHD
ncbi:hypothetical protein IWW57_001625 [Coemansia sp. S610]|nr:hypothetical protein IWW57_001625 [Coemansia sp. S610]